jgi:hypothetical protein
MDTNPFVATVYLPDSNLTLLAVETQSLAAHTTRRQVVTPASRLRVIYYCMGTPMKI